MKKNIMKKKTNKQTLWSTIRYLIRSITNTQMIMMKNIQKSNLI